MNKSVKQAIGIFAGILGTLAMSLCLAKPANAQVLYGSVVGTVTDQAGALLPNAEVKITNDLTGFTRSATSNSSGQYRIVDLPEGTYTIEASASGFKSLKQTGVRIVIGQVNQQDLQMEVGAITQGVTVEGGAPVLQTQKTDVHTEISSYAVQNLPLNIYHNFQTLELLSPGVVSISNFTNSYPNSIADAPDRSLAINSNGLPQHVNTSRVDGATNIFLWLPDHMVIVPPAATVQEVNVQTATLGVQKGLTAGAATDVITRSGTNAIHGNVYGYHSDQAIDGRNPLVHLPKRPKNIQNNDGFSIGGPIKRDKLFYFANWDGYFQRQSFVDNNLLPTTDMRDGDFTAYLGTKLFQCAAVDRVSGQCTTAGPAVMVQTTEGATVQLQQGMVFDPTTGDPNTGENRQVFSSGSVVNMIPVNRMYAGTLSYWKLLNAPRNQVGVFTPTEAINDFASRPQAWNRNIYTGKVDYNLSDRQALWVKYSLQKARLNDPSDYGIAGQGTGTGVTDDTAQTVTIGHTWTRTSNYVLAGHVGFTRMGENNKLPDFGQELGQSVLGLVNSNTPSNDKRYSGMPGITFGSGFTTLGTAQSWEPVFRNDWTLTLDENATWIRGNHEISYGVDAAHNHMNHWQPEIVCCPRGNVNMGANNTFLNLPMDPAAPGGAQLKLTDASGAGTKGFSSEPWNSIAEFDLGLASSFQNSQQFIRATNKDWQEGLYIGDVWRITSRLTADYGLRWEYFPLITRDGVDKFELYDPTTNTLKLGGIGGNSTHLGVTSSKKLFAPRLGLAYRVNDRTVVRTGFGISYDTLPLERPLRGFYPLTIGASNVTTISSNSTVNGYLPFGTFNAATNAINTIPRFGEGVPLIAAPQSFSTGAIEPDLNATIGTLAPGEFHRGYVESWNLTAERTLPRDILLSVAYVGNHLVHQFNGQELNAAPINTGVPGQPLFAAFHRTSDVYAFQGYLDSHYNSLQVALNRQTASGLFLQGSYTYSKVIGYMDDEGWEDGLFFQCPGCQALNRHTLSFDHTHVFKMAYVYQLPLGEGKKWANSSGTAKAVLGGWQTNGVLTAYSGAPLNLSVPSAANFLNAPFSGNTPDFTGTLQLPKQRGPGQFWFAPTSFVPELNPQVGTAGRGLSWLRGPGLAQLDFSLFRNFKLTERYGLEMRFETLNFSNTPHWSNPGTSCSNNAGACGGSFGQITTAFGQRIVQIGAQISF